LVSHLWANMAIVRKFRDVKTWTAWKVLAVEVEQDLKQTIQVNTGGWKGSNLDKVDNQMAFRPYQLELLKLWKGQSEVDWDRLAAIAKLWNETGTLAAQLAK
jgi:hypothetical protein